MKSRLIILALFICSSQNLFSQQKLTKSEILKEYQKNEVNPNIDSLYRWDIHLQTRKTFDELLKSGIDTLLIYSVSYPGYHTKRDSCSTMYPIHSYFFGRTKDKSFYKAVNGICESVQGVSIDDEITRFAIENYSKIKKEYFMGVITGAEKINNTLRLNEVWTDHEPKYSILIFLNGDYKYLVFTEGDLTNRKSLFLHYNRRLISFKLFKLIEKELNKKL